MESRHTLAHFGLQPELSLGEILTRSNILGEFLKKTEQLIQLNRIVLKLIDPSFAPYCRVQSFNQNILVLGTSSPMWGHKLRFKVPDLIESLRQNAQFFALKAIHIKIIPEENTPILPQNILPTPKLTRESSMVILAAANQITFSSLQKSLLRLSKRQTERHNNSETLLNSSLS